VCRHHDSYVQCARAFSVIAILTAGLAFAGAAGAYCLKDSRSPLVTMRRAFMGIACTF
jgi:hypothetical protein